MIISNDIINLLSNNNFNEAYDSCFVTDNERKLLGYVTIKDISDEFSSEELKKPFCLDIKLLSVGISMQS